MSSQYAGGGNRQTHCPDTEGTGLATSLPSTWLCSSCKPHGAIVNFVYAYAQPHIFKKYVWVCRHLACNLHLLA
jgi:hypothetical protein